MKSESQPSNKCRGLISDLKGNADDLQTVFSANPDVMNHNIETVPRLQRQVRPSADTLEASLFFPKRKMKD